MTGITITRHEAWALLYAERLLRSEADRLPAGSQVAASIRDEADLIAGIVARAEQEAS